MKTDEVLELVASTLNVPLPQLCLESRAGDFEEWDSMGVLSLLTMCDRQGINFAPGNVEHLLSVQGILRAFREAGKLA